MLDRCVLDDRLTAYAGGNQVGAGSVSTPYRLLSPLNPLMRAALARIEAKLRREGGGVYRAAADTIYGGEGIHLAAYLDSYAVEIGKHLQSCDMIARVAPRRRGWFPPRENS